MADLSLTTAQRVKVVDPDTDIQLGAVNQELFHITSADPTIAEVRWIDWRPWVYGTAVGATTIHAVRLSDNAAVDKTVEVTAPDALPPFDIAFGTPEAK